MRAFVEVNLRAIADNVSLIKRSTEAQILAVVKADAYGHGLVPVSKVAINAGATWLGVALLEEALVLRAAEIKVPIIAWLTPPSSDFKLAIESDIDLAVPSLRHLELIVVASKAAKKRARIHIEVDTGMSRGGLLDEWSTFLAAISGADVEVVGFWSHFSSADEPGAAINKEQEVEFSKKLAQLREVGVNPKYLHIANSAAALTNENSHQDIIRLGIAMYGLSPDLNNLGSSAKLGLKPAMRLKSELHLVKRVPAGTPVGYGQSERTSRDTKLAIITMGYADGIPRNTSNQAGVFVAGAKAPIIGRVSMDQFVVDLGPDSKAQAGDIAEVFGEIGYSIDDWATASSTINYEIVTRIASRVPRIYT
jgi:alanine racemase